MAQAISSKRLLQSLLFLQLTLVFFQLGIRHYLDTTLIRDVCLLLAILVYAFSSRKPVRRDPVSSIVWLMIGYGVILIFIHSLNGSSLLSAVTQFRNFFLPLAIVPIYRVVFLDEEFKSKIVNFVFILFVILLADVYLEFFFQLIGLSRDIFPWYPFQYTHLYRFSTAPDAIPGAVSPEQAPILGIQGWPLNTSATLLGLFAFVYPWLMNDNSNLKVMKFQSGSNMTKYLWLILCAGALIILQVKTTMIAFVVVILIDAFTRKGKAIKSFLTISLVFILVAALTKDFWAGIFEVFSDEFAEGELDYILNPETMGYLFNAFFSGSPIDLMFGADFSHLPNFENLEIRLLVFTLELGVVWLILFCIVYIRALKLGKRFLKKNRGVCLIDPLFVKGILLTLIAYLIDMLHYANQMYLFNIFFFGVMLALMSSIIIQNRYAKSISSSTGL